MVEIVTKSMETGYFVWIVVGAILIVGSICGTIRSIFISRNERGESDEAKIAHLEAEARKTEAFWDKDR